MKTKVDKKNILKQMFDVRPTKRAGILDIEKIFNIGSVLDVRKMHEQKRARFRKFLLNLEEYKTDKRERKFEADRPAIGDIYRTEKDILDIEAERFKYFHEALNSAPLKEAVKEGAGGTLKEEKECQEAEEIQIERPIIIIRETESKKDRMEFREFCQKIKNGFEKANSAAAETISPLFYHWKRSLAVFAIVCCVISSSVGAFAFYQKGAEKAAALKDLGIQGFYSILGAKSAIEIGDFKKARANFSNARDYFEKAQEQISPAENLFAKIPDLFGNSLPSSGIRLLKTGQHISIAGEKSVQAFLPLFESGSSALNSGMIEALLQADKLLGEALNEIKLANAEAKLISEASLPEENREYAKSLKENLPEIQNILGKSTKYLSNILEILGNKNPKKYLLIFQNNSELRATGGFIGSFAALDAYKGNISEIKVDDIYNPAGQLLEKIVPPLPLKKVTDRWNIFDANHFANFPDSAKKIAWFYEKTGGQTVDGVIAFTPKVLEDLLKMLGPIELKEYKITVAAKNFADTMQFEIEENYDKTKNQPKKVIADLAQILMEKILSSKQKDWQKLLEILRNNLDEKHILIYFSSQSQERMIEEEGWAGEVLPNQQDYLQIVHTNINGYKTDRKIQEKVSHEISIDSSGQITDTVIITKKHNGGATGYDWYDRQNSDFVRVFIPLGSNLISAEGFSKEEIYSKTKDFSGFIKDPDVERIEQNMERDLETGVFIFQESEKTVFGGWMYAEPGETSTVKLTYRLPFKISPEDSSYNILYQKQSGHPGFQLTTQVLKLQDLIDEKARNLFEDEKYETEI